MNFLMGEINMEWIRYIRCVVKYQLACLWQVDTFIIIFNVLPVQFVVPGKTEADSSPIHTSGGVYPYWPNRTVDGNFSQNIKACLHTAVSGVAEAWLRIDLQTVKSIKSVKFWYRNDSKYLSKGNFNAFNAFFSRFIL